MMRVSRALVGVLALASGPALALYEDQAGKVDWCAASCDPVHGSVQRVALSLTHLCARRSRIDRYRQQIGEAKHALFHATGQQRLALVATEPGVLAGIDLRNGQIAWRQVLPAGEQVTSISQHGKGLLSVSVAAGGAFVRLWSSMGGLVWDAHVPVQLTPGVDSPAPSIASAGSSVIVGWQKALRAFHSGTGELLWEIDSREGSQLAALVEPKPVESTSTAASTTSAAQGLASPSPPLHAYAIDEASGTLEVTVYEATGKGSRAELEAKSTTKLAVHGAKPRPSLAVLTLDGTLMVMMDMSGTTLLVHEVRLMASDGL
jgi:outer membrane protein assembly factor BamB